MTPPPGPLTSQQRQLIDRVSHAIADGMRSSLKREIHVGKQGRYDDEDVMRRSAPIRALEVQFEGAIKDCIVVLANLRPDQAIDAVAGASQELIRQFGALATATAYPPELHEIAEHEDAVEMLEALHLEPTVQLNADLGGDFLVILGSGLLESLESIGSSGTAAPSVLGSSPVSGRASAGAISSSDVDAMADAILSSDAPPPVAMPAAPAVPAMSPDEIARRADEIFAQRSGPAATPAGSNDPTYRDTPAALEAQAEAILSGGMAPPLGIDPGLVVDTDLAARGVHPGLEVVAAAGADQPGDAPLVPSGAPAVPMAPAASAMGADLGALADAILAGEAPDVAAAMAPQRFSTPAELAATAHANAAAASQPLHERWGALLSGVQVEVSAELGRTGMRLGDVTSLEDDGVITLDETVDDPVTVYVNGALYATARLVEVDGQYGIEILEVLEPEHV